MRGRAGIVLLGVVALVGAVLAPARAASGYLPAAASGRWSTGVGLPKQTRDDLAAYPLGDGGLVTVGSDFGNFEYIYAAHRWSPTTGTWTTGAAPAVTQRVAASAAQLGDGRVLVIGGTSGGQALSSTEVYDPLADTWTPGPTLLVGRWNASAVMLADGRVLVAGGRTAAEDLTSTEILDVAAGTSVAAGALAHPTYKSPLYLLGGGIAFLATSPSQLFDPATGTWSDAPSPGTGSASSPAVVLPDGRLLGLVGSADPQTRAAQIFDPASGSWTGAPALLTARANPLVTLLADGRVLVAGGITNGAALRSAEVLDLADLGAGWRPVGPTAFEYPYFSDAARLVALGGGGTALIGGTDRTLERFDPAAPPISYSYEFSVDGTSSTQSVGGVKRFKLSLRELASARGLAGVSLLGGIVSGPTQGLEYCSSSPGPCVTDGGGRAEFVVASTNGPGTDVIELTADMDGDGLIDADEPRLSMSVTWERIVTTLTAGAFLQADPDGKVLTLDAPSVGTLKAWLTKTDQGDYGSFQRGLAFKTVTFRVGTKTVCTSLTDVSGEATCAAAAELVAAINNKGYDVSFAGERDYVPSSTHAKFVDAPRLPL